MVGKRQGDMMKMTGVALAAVLVVAAPTGGRAGDTRDDPAPFDGTFSATLDGFEEVPSISSPARGDFRARRVDDGGTVRIDYELSYTGFPGAPAAAHIHFAQRGVNGAVSAFLCGGGDKPSCPAEGSVTGTIDAQDVVGPAARGIAAGELDELIRAMEAGATYANVHSAQYPDGEIRGQIEAGREDDDE